jgi:hypothetical protein
MSTDWLSYAAQILGVVVIIAVGAWLAGLVQARVRSRSGVTLFEYYEKLLVESRRTNELLERIAVAQEKRATIATRAGGV